MSTAPLSDVNTSRENSGSSAQQGPPPQTTFDVASARYPQPGLPYLTSNGSVSKFMPNGAMPYQPSGPPFPPYLPSMSSQPSSALPPTLVPQMPLSSGQPLFPGQMAAYDTTNFGTMIQGAGSVPYMGMASGPSNTLPQPGPSKSSTSRQGTKKRKVPPSNAQNNGVASFVASPAALDDTASGEEGSVKGKRDKRVKTARACDSWVVVHTKNSKYTSAENRCRCRRKKIRCDVIEEDPPLCKHCKAHNFECTWVSFVRCIASVGSRLF